MSRAVKDLDGKVAVVTGAAGGIGLALATALAGAGMRVVLADLDESVLGTEVERLRSSGATVAGERVDVRDADDVEALAAKVVERFGALHVAVNNAGIVRTGPAWELSLDDWRNVLDVNLWGVIHGCRLFGAQLVAGGRGGHIVNVASAAAFAPSRILPAYATTKAAVLMLSECLRAELAPHGIGVSAICPGIIDTDIVRTAHYAGEDGGGPDRRREAAMRLYRRRAYSADRVAERILVAVRRNVAVMPVAPEAHALRALSRISPSVVRRLARIAPL